MAKKKGKSQGASAAGSPVMPSTEPEKTEVTSMPYGDDPRPTEEASHQGDATADEAAPLRPKGDKSQGASYSDLEKSSRQQSTGGEHKATVRRRCARIILTRHLLAAMAERMFEFAVVLLLTVVGPHGSFSLIASYGVTVSLVVALLSPSLGAFFDRSNRLNSVTAVTIVQNICTASCAGIFIILLYNTTIAQRSLWWTILVALIHFFGAFNSLFYGLSSMTLERDWVVVIADDDADWLRNITSALKQIDLGCDLVAPSLVSLLAMYSYEAVAIFISVANSLMILVQYSAFHRVYSWVPSLEKGLKVLEEDHHHRLDDDDDTDGLIKKEVKSPRSSGGWPWPVMRMLREFCSHAAVYARQGSFLPGVATAMLYLTVLSFHVVMVSYLLMRGLHVGVIGLAQGLASGAGVLGAMAYDRVAVRTGTMAAATIGIWWQSAFLAVGLAVLLYPCLVEGWIISDGRLLGDVSLPIFLAAVIFSRFGLFLYEVAVVQLFQLMVEETERNSVAGFQRTLESLFELASFVMVFCLPSPDQFPLQAVISYAMVFGAASLYTFWTIQRANASTTGRADSSSPSSGPRPWYRLKARDPDLEAQNLVLKTPNGDLLPSRMIFQRLDTIASVGSAGEKGSSASLNDNPITPISSNL